MHILLNKTYIIILNDKETWEISSNSILRKKMKHILMSMRESLPGLLKPFLSDLARISSVSGISLHLNSVSVTL